MHFAVGDVEKVHVGKHHLWCEPCHTVTVSFSVGVAMVFGPRVLSALNSCCSRFCSNAAVNLINCSFSLS